MIRWNRELFSIVNILKGSYNLTPYIRSIDI